MTREPCRYQTTLTKLACGTLFASSLPDRPLFNLASSPLSRAGCSFAIPRHINPTFQLPQACIIAAVHRFDPSSLSRCKAAQLLSSCFLLSDSIQTSLLLLATQRTNWTLASESFRSPQSLPFEETVGSTTALPSLRCLQLSTDQSLLRAF